MGKIQSVGIKREYRGNELAVEMMQFILKEMKKADIDITFIVCWKPGGIVPLGKTLAKCQFDYLTEAKKIWYDDMELICPHCKGRCRCRCGNLLQITLGGMRMKIKLLPKFIISLGIVGLILTIATSLFSYATFEILP